MRILDLEKLDEYHYKEIAKLFEEEKVLQDRINLSYIYEILLWAFMAIIVILDIYFTVTSENFDSDFSIYMLIFVVFLLFIRNSIKVNQLIKYIKKSNSISRQE